ncbi:60S ribosomal protein L13 [Oopsacas minuta]|uniref:60S ribosomal protein L13 n=1 Tax=Oopsacas minuta TaxID=111878 RepID=A0AAV7JWG3_9METZ|nr:60S ribosomal protein L13 [Oopsacas minuta]
MGKRNGMIPNGHFHKDWQSRIRTWFNQPGRKDRRRKTRQKRALRIAPRPVSGVFRPTVHCQTVKYNHRLRLGRGFTLDELKAAGISKKFAPTIGISVDHRRKNRSLECLQRNVQRLKEYQGRMILFPVNKKKPKPGDSSQKECDTALQLKTKRLLPLKKTLHREKPRKIPKSLKRVHVFGVLRQAKMEKKNVGREAREAARAEKGLAQKGKGKGKKK